MLYFSVSREAYPEVVVTDVQFAYNITNLVNLDKKRSVWGLVIHGASKGTREHISRLEWSTALV